MKIKTGKLIFLSKLNYTMPIFPVMYYLFFFKIYVFSEQF